MKTEIIELLCECGEKDTVVAVVGDTRILKVLKQHECKPLCIESKEYAIQYAHACGYHD